MHTRSFQLPTVAAPLFAVVLVFLASPALTDDLQDQRQNQRQGPRLGTEVTQDEIQAWSLSVFPDGTGLPPGSGNATVGASIYKQKCLSCHGPGGVNGQNDRLVGGEGTIDSDSPVRTLGSYWPYATTVFDFIRRAMPLTQPQSLTDDEVYALTAYLLAANGIIAKDEVMNAETLPAVEMPNEKNFVWDDQAMDEQR